MKNMVRTLVLLSPAFMLFGCGEEPAAPASYSADVKPFLEKYCTRCHTEGGEGAETSGFQMVSYESLMKGTKFGPVITPGDSFSSVLVMLVEGRADPSISMPHDKGEAPTPAEIEKLKAWIDQGAKNN
jgi:hypothetical protein